MPRIRSIKPEFWGDEDIATDLNMPERLLYIALWNFCHDNWTMEYRPRTIKAQVFPFDDDITAESVEKMIQSLERSGRVVFYEHQGQRCIWMPKCAEHQRVDKPKPSPLPIPQDASSNSPRHVDDASTNAGESMPDLRERHRQDSSTTRPRHVDDESTQGRDRDKERIGGEGTRADARAATLPQCLTAEVEGTAWLSNDDTEHPTPARALLHAVEQAAGELIAPKDLATLITIVCSTCPPSCQGGKDNIAECLGVLLKAAEKTHGRATPLFRRIAKEDRGHLR